MSSVKARFCVTFGSSKDIKSIMYIDGCQRRFAESDRELYYMDMLPKGTVLVNTVAKNKSKYINRDYSRADLACKILRIIGQPIKRKFRKIIANKQLKNCPVTTEDIRAARNIFGPDVGSLKGKQVRQTPQKVAMPITNITSQIMKHYH